MQPTTCRRSAWRISDPVYFDADFQTAVAGTEVGAFDRGDVLIISADGDFHIAVIGQIVVSWIEADPASGGQVNFRPCVRHSRSHSRSQTFYRDSLDADGNTLANVTTTEYNPDGTVAETDGDQTYRVAHTYDYAQRQKTMTTYGTEQATTTWYYSTTRGHLTRKAYDDGNGTDYTYTDAGRLETRGWARGVGTAYTYDNGGRLTGTTYSDDTPDISVSYDSLGRKTSESSLLSSVSRSSVSYTYNPATLALDTETIAYDLDADNTVDFTRVLDRSQDTLGRDTGWQLKDGSNVENSATYQYSATEGRLSKVLGLASSSLPSPEFTYGYATNSSLVASVTGPAHTVTNTWETTRDVLANKENKVDTTVVSSYGYNVNHLGQRTGVDKAGTAFGSTRSIGWGYNSKGEVVKADSSITGLDRAYQYDGIGNRLKSADSLTLPTTNNYTPNALNQYTALTLGSAGVSPEYDDDGNMTSGPLPADVDSASDLVWDAENRLISATVDAITVTYLYDSQSRRISTTTGGNTTICVYDGWNPIAEYSIQNSTFAIQNSFTWGTDLSGSLQGAGGVGGLLVVTEHDGSSSESYFPTYDGNGNISEYLDDEGAVVAHYEYDPFGRETVSNGTKANDFAHRFSTKQLDSVTGLLYYGYRWMDPLTGRWPSRDPIEEEGGVNLYGFLENRTLNFVDSLGLYASILMVLDFANDPSDAARQDSVKADMARAIELAKKLRLELSSMSDTEFDNKTRNGIFARWWVDDGGAMRTEAEDREVHVGRTALMQWMEWEESSSISALQIHNDLTPADVFKALRAIPPGSPEYQFDTAQIMIHGSEPGGAWIGGPTGKIGYNRRIGFDLLRSVLGELYHFETRALTSCGANCPVYAWEVLRYAGYVWDESGHECTLTFTPIQAGHDLSETK